MRLPEELAECEILAISVEREENHRLIAHGKIKSLRLFLRTQDGDGVAVDISAKRNCDEAWLEVTECDSS